jgi:hypothetical protein
VVAGYTDSVGQEDYNYELGQRRATSVAGYLVSKKGLDPMQVRVVSYGGSKPVADNSTPRGRRRNRRVEILVFQDKDRDRELIGHATSNCLRPPRELESAFIGPVRRVRSAGEFTAMIDGPSQIAPG